MNDQEDEDNEDYCKAKNISVYSFLIDKVGFEIEWEPSVSDINNSSNNQL